MAINYEQLMAMKKLGQKYSYSDRDVLLYALAIGMGADPLDEKELAFVNEAAVTPRPLKVVPTFASVAAGFAEPGEFNQNSIALDGRAGYHVSQHTSARCPYHGRLLGDL
ncbi:hypothetical protein ACVWZ6_002588 [Bradyrhizobium sp. GM6.1]